MEDHSSKEMDIRVPTQQTNALPTARAGVTHPSVSRGKSSRANGGWEGFGICWESNCITRIHGEFAHWLCANVSSLL